MLVPKVCSGLLLLVILFFNSAEVVSQNRVDSLKNIVSRGEISGEDRVQNLILLSVELVYVNPSEAFSYAEQGLRLAQSINFREGIASAYRIIGSIYATQDNYISASDFIQKALRIYEKKQDSAGIANCYISLGHTFRFQKNVDEELKYHRISYRMYEDLGIVERIGVTAHNFGESLLNAGKVDSALILTEYAISINDSLGRKSVLSSCYKALGRIYYEKNNYESAEGAFQKVIEISDELGPNSQKLALIESLIYLSKIYQQSGSPEQQYAMLNSALKLNKEYYFYGFTGQIYEDLISYHIENDELVKARDLFYSSNIKLDSIETRQQLDRSELMMNAIKVYKLQDEAQLREELIEQQEKLLYLTIAFIIIMAGAVFSVIVINQRLKETNQKLEDQKRIVEQQRGELQKLNASKDKFFGIVAHDLRGPVGGLKQLLQIYFDDEMAVSETDQKKLKKSILKSSATTYNLVVNLISWAKLQMQNESVDPEAVDVGKLTDLIYDIYEQKAFQKRISLSKNIPDHIRVFADYNHIKLVLRNLINNALKYTPPGGVITVEAVEDADKIRIEVADNGIGMSKSVQETLFNLEQHSSTAGTEGEQGSGLGLILGKEYVELNKGTFNFISNEGDGTTFIITLSKA